jgi:ABC-2 type transport system permease protein/oleandomycin transport system permease protein
MFVVAYLVGYRLHEGLIEALLGFVLAILVGYSFTWVAAFAGLSLKTVEAVQAATFTLVFPVVFASSAFVPDANFPGWLQAWSHVNPVSIWSDTLRVLTLGELYTNAPSSLVGDVAPLGTLLWQSTAWFVGILALFVPLGVRVYRRT